MAKEKLAEKVKGLLKTDGDLYFLSELKKEELERWLLVPAIGWIRWVSEI